MRSARSLASLPELTKKTTPSLSGRGNVPSSRRASVDRFGWR
jgi:hypothetical protein